MIVIRESVYQSVAKVLRIAVFVVGPLVLAAAGLTIWYGIPESGFTTENTARVNQSIRDYYAQKNLQVAEISLIRESKQKLSGFIMVRVPGIAEPIQKTCTATLDDALENFIWSCG